VRKGQVWGGVRRRPNYKRDDTIWQPPCREPFGSRCHGTGSGGFAAGIIGTGLIAVPVLAGSAAYALGEGLSWTTGLARLPIDAKAFYGTIAVATLIGMFINFVGIDPIKALFWAGAERRRRRPTDGHNHAHGHAEASDGSIYPSTTALGDGLALHRSDHRRRRRDV
jgi:hypothetical protein